MTEFNYCFSIFQLIEKIKSEPILNEKPKNSPKFNEVNYGASTSGSSSSLSEASHEHGTSFSHDKQETQTAQNQTKQNSDNNVTRIPLTPEQVAVEQILWVNRMYAIQMTEYWQSYVFLFYKNYLCLLIIKHCCL